MPSEPGLAWHVASFLGLLLLVVAYVVNQRGRCRPDSVAYLAANVLGSGLLAAYSARIEEPALFALEAFWCGASLWALWKLRSETGARADA